MSHPDHPQRERLGLSSLAPRRPRPSGTSPVIHWFRELDGLERVTLTGFGSGVLVVSVAQAPNALSDGRITSGELLVTCVILMLLLWLPLSAWGTRQVYNQHESFQRFFDGSTSGGGAAAMILVGFFAGAELLPAAVTFIWQDLLVPLVRLPFGRD